MLAVLLAVCFAGCEDRLNISKHGSLGSPDEYYQTDTEAEAAVASMYASWRDLHYNWYFVLNCMSDDAWTADGQRNDNADMEKLNEFNYDTDHSMIQGLYSGLYTLIYKANLIIDNVTGDSQTMRRAVAEAHVARGWAHFYLVTLWGTAPVVDHVLANSEYHVSNGTPEDTWAFVETEFRTAIDSQALPTKSSVDGKVDQDTIISAINQSAEKIKIMASKIELTGSVTFSMLDSATQSKITDAQTNAERAFDKADLAQTDASSASSAATAAQNTADQAWDKADIAQSDASSASTAASAAQNTADQAWDKADMAQSWTNSYGTRTNNLYAMVTKWTDGAVSTTTEINGGWIKTNTITADKIGIGDFTNMARCDPDSQSSYQGWSRISYNNKYYFEVKGSSYPSLQLARSNKVEFQVGDYYKVGAYCNCNNSVSFIIRYFYTDGTWQNAGAASVTVGSNLGYYEWGVKIVNAPQAGKTVSNVQFFLEVSTSGASKTLTIREIYLRKMYTGELIVDGSITAEKISVSDLYTLKATIANWHMASNYLWSQSGTNRYSVIKSDGDVMIATNSPSYTDTTGATCQIWHDGHITVGDTKNGGIRTEIDGDTFEMFNAGGYAFQLNYNGGMELWGNASGNKTPYIDFHYNGSMQDYSVRLICNGADTLMVDGGTLNTASDISLKEDVKTLDQQFVAFFRAIVPITFRYKEKSQKMQIGYNANNIEEAILGAGMDPAKLGLYHVDDEGIRSLAYMEFSPLNTYMIQRCMDRIAALEKEVLRLRTAAVV